MYNLINTKRNQIVTHARPHTVDAIAQYERLFRDLNATNVKSDAGFQTRYKRFWVMRFPAKRYFVQYFDLLELQKSSRLLSPDVVCRTLQPASKGRKGGDIIQFSFASKMAHMANPNMPIYDQMIRQFYFLPASDSKQSFNDRLTVYMASYAFLQWEYHRVLTNNLLSPAVTTFRQTFPGCTFTNVKVIDWLIWQFVGMANSGYFQNKTFLHS